MQVYFNFTLYKYMLNISALSQANWIMLIQKFYKGNYSELQCKIHFKFYGVNVVYLFSVCNITVTS
jgi:hypothetical protein